MTAPSTQAALLTALLQNSLQTSHNPENITWPTTFTFTSSDHTWIVPGQIFLAILNSNNIVCPILTLGIRQSALDSELGLHILFGLTLTAHSSTSDAAAPPQLIRINLTSDANPARVCLAPKKALTPAVTLAPPGSSPANTKTIPKLLPCPVEWITPFTQQATSASEAYHLTWIHDFDFDQPTVTEFQAWTRAAATASETDPTISALATNADLLPLDQLPTLEHDLQTWLTDQVSHLDPVIQEAWTTAIATPSFAEQRSGHQNNNPRSTSPPNPTNTPVSTTDIMAAITTMGDTFGDKLAAALQSQHQPPQAGLMPDQIVQLVAHINQMTQRNQVPTQEQPIPAGRLSTEQRIALHGWSNLSPSEPLAEFWTHYDNTKTTGTLETTIKHHLFKPLQTAEPTFDSTILNKTLIATVSTQAFIPMGKNLGLGPLACVFRPRGEITKLDNNYALLQESKSVSVSDTQRTKLNTPVPPTDPTAFDGLLRRLIVLHATLFTERCPMVTQLTQLHTALCQRMGFYLERSPVFRASTAPAILATLTRAVTEFFEMIPTQSELDCDTYPTVPVLPTLLEKIKDGNTLEDMKDIPDMFFHPTVLKERQQLPPPPPAHSSGFSIISALTTPTKFSNQGNRSPALTTRLNPNHHPALAAAVQSWKTSHPNSPLPRLRDILTCNKMDTNEALTTCNLAPTDCLRYVLLGSCVGTCSLNHPNHTNLPPEFLNNFCVALNETRPSKCLKPHTGS
ncbi:hypothetical protein IV203_007160 [Nitzschia inconspicua]|uniref:Uncharacterized protein n=1 Tax=Nitzschia inconspicua TaxID=303405 RepID=A0A9K3KEF0_9STRA|nr:hypothetical protein IV203_007160 [Nitzschia inconspicua]